MKEVFGSCLFFSETSYKSKNFLK